MRPPHEIKRGQRGARPGIPRKSRSTDDEAEVYDPEVMESVDSELSEDDSLNHRTAGNHQNYPLPTPHKMSTDLLKQEERYLKPSDMCHLSPKAEAADCRSLSPQMLSESKHLFPVKKEIGRAHV